MTKKRRLFFAVMAILLAAMIVIPTLIMIIESVVALAVSQAEIDTLEERKKGIASQRAEIQAQISELESKQATVLEQKTALDAQNELARQEIEIITEQIDSYTKLVELKGEELEKATEDEVFQTDLYRTRVRIMEENGIFTYLSILFKATSFSDFLSRIDFIAEIMRYDSELEASFITARENVEQVKADFEETKELSEGKKAELLDKKDQLEREIEAAFLMIRAIEEDIGTHRAEVEAHEASEKEVQSEIDAMIAELARLEEAAKQAAESAGNEVYNPGTAVGSSGNYVWPLPSSYNVTSEFGNRPHPLFGEVRFHAGIDISGSSGLPIIAADGGVVQIASPSPSYGNYVMIDHGNGNTTLYAHMTNYIVSVGQQVVQGETIGYVGSTGWSTGPHLHFEVTSGGVRVDPMSFFSYG